MECVFLRHSSDSDINEFCGIKVYVKGETARKNWKVDGVTSQKYCNTGIFRECQRYLAFMEYKKG